MGVFSPIGIGRESFEQGVLDGTNGIGTIGLMDVSGVPGHVGGELPEFTLSSARKEHLSRQRKSIKVMCRDIQLGVDRPDATGGRLRCRSDVLPSGISDPQCHPIVLRG